MLSKKEFKTENVGYSGIRITHKPTGINAFVEDRNWTWNKKEAIKILKSKFKEIKKWRKNAR